MVLPWIMDLYYGIIFSSPAYFANATPVFVSGLGRIDKGKLFFDGRPILGSHKTWGGVLGAVFAGGFLGFTAPLFFPEIFYNSEVIGYNWYIGFLMGFGAILGDAIGSFFKRRLNLKPGGPFPIVDQIGFILTAFLLVSPFMIFPLRWMLYVVPFTLLGHLAANFLAYAFGWKDVWW